MIFGHFFEKYSSCKFSHFFLVVSHFFQFKPKFYHSNCSAISFVFGWTTVGNDEKSWAKPEKNGKNF